MVMVLVLLREIKKGLCLKLSTNKLSKDEQEKEQIEFLSQLLVGLMLENQPP